MPSAAPVRLSVFAVSTTPDLLGRPDGSLRELQQLEQLSEILRLPAPQLVIPGQKLDPGGAGATPSVAPHSVALAVAHWTSNG